MNKPVSFEIVKLLKSKKFDVEDRNKYQMYGTQNIPQLEFYNEIRWNIYKDYYLAPTISEVIMWLYEKYGIWITVERVLNGNYFSWISSTSKESFCNDELYKSQTTAYEEAIKYCLETIIK